MKKFKSLIFALLFTLIIPVYADAEIISHKIYASSTETVEQANMEEGNVLKFKTVDEYKLTNDTSVEKDAILTVRINDYIAPKRGKLNGYLKILVESYTIPSENDKEIDVKDKNITGTLKLTNKINKGEILEKTGAIVAVVALDIPGLSQMYAATKGLVKPNEGETRLKSVGTNLYKSSGLKYIEKGHDLVLKENSLVEISVKSKESE